MHKKNYDCTFVNPLINWWYKTNNVRNYPWRTTKSIYKFIIAEMLLQRTKRNTVLTVYKRFIEKYPTAEKLARANPKEIIDIIYPLGLRKRADILIKFGNALLNAKQPIDDYETLRKLPGVGDYIASVFLAVFLEKNNIVAIDKNVARIFIRLFGIIPSNKTRPQDDKKVRDKAFECIPKNASREYTLALLDLGWEICVPRNPKCEICPLKKICYFSKNRGPKNEAKKQNKKI